MLPTTRRASLRIHATRFPAMKFLATPLLALALITAVAVPPAHADRYDDHYNDRRGNGYNSEYIFAATRSVTAMDVSPALKVPLIPITIVLDLVALPFEAVAGLF
jgi:hypothetical protein